MKRRKNIIITGLIVAAVTVAGVSAYAAEDIVEDTKEVIERGMKGFRDGNKDGQRGGQKQGGFEKAVEEGILTEAEAQAIEAYQEANALDKEAIKAEIEDMTREEAKAYMQENYPKSEDPMADLVEAGLLDQDQVDQIEALREEAVSNRPEKVEGTERPEISEDGERPEGMGGRGQGGMRPTTEDNGAVPAQGAGPRR